MTFSPPFDSLRGREHCCIGRHRDIETFLQVYLGAEDPAVTLSTVVTILPIAKKANNADGLLCGFTTLLQLIHVSLENGTLERFFKRIIEQSFWRLNCHPVCSPPGKRLTLAAAAAPP